MGREDKQLAWPGLRKYLRNILPELRPIWGARLADAFVTLIEPCYL